MKYLDKESGQSTEQEDQKQETSINDLPNELLVHIFSMLDYHSLTRSSKVSHTTQEIAESIPLHFLFRPDSVFQIASYLPFSDAMRFIAQYRNSKEYKALESKPQKKPIEVLCHALTTPNIYTIDPIELENAISIISKENLDKDTQMCLEGLKITLEAVKNKEKPQSVVDYISTNKKDNNFTNLAGLYLRNPTKISNINLTNINLQYSYIYGATWKNVNFNSSNLAGAKIDTSTLTQVTFQDTNLYDTKLVELKLSNSSFDRCNLKSATIQYCKIESTNFVQVNLEGANLRGSYFRETTIENSNLTGCSINI